MATCASIAWEIAWIEEVGMMWLEMLTSASLVRTQDLSGAALLSPPTAPEEGVPDNANSSFLKTYRS